MSPNTSTPKAPTVKTATSLAELTQQCDSWQAAGQSIAFVPTMGALHAGHLSLVRQARAMADKVVVSIFVNPIQFGPNEDFAKYPRTLAADLELLAQDCDLVFLPSTASMYPEGFQTRVQNGQIAAELCGQSRPGHFDGVLTIVLKLLNLVRPRFAIFGKKDYQQWRLIERMVRDLEVRVEIIGGAIVREPDGLAMSSRNRYLAEGERQRAAHIHVGLRAAQKLYQAGERQVAALRSGFVAPAQQAGLNLEYCEVRRQDDLTAFADVIDAPCVMLVAARVGSTRLIDNLEMD